jgi:Protein of unknown function (DUF2586)
MGRPNVSIIIVKDRLGRQTAAQDGTSLLYVGLPNTYPLYSALALGMVFNSLRNAEDAGITQALDISNEILLWEHIKDFYTNAPEGTALHVLAFAKSTSYQALFTAPVTNPLESYLAAQAGEVKLLAVAPNTDVTDAATKNNITDVVDSLALVNGFAESEFTKKRPLLILLEGRNFNPTGSVPNLRTITGANRVAVIVARNPQSVDTLITAGIDNAIDMAAIGFMLGKIAKIPVQRSIARVKDGDLGWVSASFSGGNLVSSYTDGELDAINDKGYIFACKIVGKNGFFFNDEPTCTAATDDYAFISHNRTIDKVVRIVNQIFTEELSDEINIDATTGKMPVTVAKDLQNKCENAINIQMTNLGEISAVDCVIDPNQNVLQTDTINVEVNVVKKGIKKFFKVKIYIHIF